MKHITIFLTALLLLGVMKSHAQPAKFAFTPNNLSGTFLGQATIGGSAAAAADWVAAFDSSGVCAGAAQVIINGGLAYINLPIYGDDLTTSGTDEGMSGTEAFTLVIWDASANLCFPVQDPCSPIQFPNWVNTNGAPMPGYDDPTVSFNFIVISQPSASLAPFGDICENEVPFTLTGGSPTGGNYSGPGIVGGNGSFDPAISGQGTFTITYIYEDSNCQADTATETITVLSAPQASAPSLAPVCLDAPVFLLPGVSTGSWTGLGVISPDMFDPAAAGIGVHILDYTVSSPNGCTDVDTASITVSGTNTSLALSSLLCENDPVSLLDGGTPAGGTYDGIGVVGTDMVDPSVLGAGMHTITYTYTDAQGCSASAMDDLTIFAAPSQPSVGVAGNLLTSSVSESVYAWYVNGTLLVDSSNQTITPSDTGFYQVEVITLDGCSEISDSLYFEPIIADIGDVLPGASLAIYPNPSDGMVFLSVENLPSGVPLTVTIQDLRGRLISQQALSQSGTYIHSMDLSNQSKGLYLLRVHAEGQQVFGERLLLK